MYPSVSPPTVTGITRSRVENLPEPPTSPKVALMTSFWGGSLIREKRPIAPGFVLSMIPMSSPTMETSLIPLRRRDST